MVREILKTLDTRKAEIIANPEERHPKLKVAGLAVAEGLIDGFVIVGAEVFTIGMVTKILLKIAK